jgi:hypothetical protein
MNAGMTSFRLWRPPKLKPPPYSWTDDERSRYKAQFRSVARKYRIFAGVTAGSFIATWLLVFLATRGPGGHALVWLAGICALAFVACILYGPILLCPACSQVLGGKKLASTCPECGGRLVEDQRCSACGRTFSRAGKARGYTLRYCTNCGIKLDDKGI